VNQNSFCRSCIRYFLGAPSLKGALFEHNGPSRGLLRALRGTAPQRAAGWALRLLDRQGKIEEWRADNIELVTHAPQNSKKGRSGLSYLTEEVSREINAAFAPRAFLKLKEHNQHGRSLENRMDTSCFVELAVPGPWVKGRHVLVLDDVNTTGTTLDLCAYVLQKAGASKVQCYAIARQSSAAPSGQT
jgi:predicted amidophosphoribosyltransferase